MDIRNVNFGMTKQEVLSNEKENLSFCEKDVIAYDNLKLVGFDAYLYYHFSSTNELYGVTYLLFNKDCFSVLKNKLNNMYGQCQLVKGSSNDLMWQKNDDIHINLILGDKDVSLNYVSQKIYNKKINDEFGL